MPIDLNFAMEVICPAASSAYLIMGVPNPILPPGFTLVGAIRADMQQAAPAMALAGAVEHHMVNAMLSESSIFGLVAWDAVEKTALVAIRGTKTVWEWIGDIDAVPVPFFPKLDAGLVHMGFQLLYTHIRQSISDLLAAGCKDARRILVTGHSLGGSLAQLCAVDLAVTVPSRVKPELYTLAGPRAGAPDFAETTKNALPRFYRIVNFFDVVPQVPLPPLFQHAGEEVLVRGGFRPLDVTYAHHLTTYLAGLKKLLPQPLPAAAQVMAAGSVQPLVQGVGNPSIPVPFSGALEKA